MPLTGVKALKRPHASGASAPGRHSGTRESANPTPKPQRWEPAAGSCRQALPAKLFSNSLIPFAIFPARFCSLFPPKAHNRIMPQSSSNSICLRPMGHRPEINTPSPPPMFFFSTEGGHVFVRSISPCLRFCHGIQNLRRRHQALGQPHPTSRDDRDASLYAPTFTFQRRVLFQSCASRIMWPQWDLQAAVPSAPALL